MTDDATTFDLIVIGLGPGGEHVAGTLAEKGLRVLGVDHGLVGGECPYWGCVPSKMMVRAADALAEARRVGDLAGRVGEVVPDWSVVARRIREEATDDWNDKAAVERFTGKGGTFVRGTGRLTAPGTVDVDGTRYAARQGVVVNTGTRAAIPPVPGLDETPHWTNHEIIEARELPASLVVLGGGAIGCELGQVMARFGVEVTIIEAAPRLVALEEPEAGDLLKQVLEAEGVTVHVGAAAERVAADGDGVAVHLAGGTVVRGERLLVATGRHADPAAVGLDTVGVPKDARTAPVDDRCRVTGNADDEGAARVWAVGDITGKGAFTHVSMYQAGVVIRDVLGEDGPPADYEALPRVTFTDPEVGAVGLTEAQARERYSSVQVGLTPLAETTRGWIHAKGNEGFIKVVSDADRGVLVGATTMGPAGGEVMGALAVAVHAHVPIERLRSMIYAYPTFHRGIEDALGRLA
ncbi:pyridine nucleotide-disulfide oxidoreductase [Intrasporangium oryzae NRRL B-24470]|uniref:Pyridine nucleotide-disulfide oxidoreductase n=1 Tax=Intrasporangium oryzae NRRL B-24470 TaxID=1386089 RepID=W9G7J9_9MICO|nr:NAD(P)/FAD-dependent oxidoreductase [Intrasporangium oryzae]EWT02161.1 pyridine nucleotide-disulfide oxidoreductase [Intrasporangium oryzae NRRL B-24470]